MVFCALKPSLRAASCCKVDVVNGGAGLRRRCLRSTLSTVSTPSAASRSVRSTSRACASVVKLNCSTLAPRYSTSLPGNFCSECLSSASIVQYSRGDERGDLVLAFADHAQRRALHAAGGQSRANLLPQQRRQIESHQEIEGTPRLLGVDQVDRQLARLRHRLLNRRLGDLVEHHPLHGLALQFAFGLQAARTDARKSLRPRDRGRSRGTATSAFFSARDMASTCF